MVIEYIGELIRTEVSENREKIYNKNVSRAIPCFELLFLGLMHLKLNY